MTNPYPMSNRPRRSSNSGWTLAIIAAAVVLCILAVLVVLL